MFVDHFPAVGNDTHFFDWTHAYSFDTVWSEIKNSRSFSFVAIAVVIFAPARKENCNEAWISWSKKYNTFTLWITEILISQE